MKNKETKLLIVVDMVNGFVKEGALADPKIAKIVPEITRLIEQTIDEGNRVVFVKDTHHENSKEFESFPPHCIKGTSEAELIDEFKLYEELDLATSYEKNSTSTMFAKGFLKDLEEMEELNEVVITGCCTDICITNLAIPLKNYLNENDKDVRVIVPENAVDTYDSEWHNRDEWNLMGLAMMKQAGVEVLKEYKAETDIHHEWKTIS
ncbi:MAG: cysteine hydrolase family protein [Candidatus Dojkabacteria bacterium]|jgi:nicotinamidase-related amidase